jgi:predicted PurR-regulated permease PerM
VINNQKIFSVLVILAFLYIASPLLFPILMGGILAVLFFPWLECLERKKISKSMGSLLLTFGITLVLILPASLLISLSAKTGFSQLQVWRKAQTPEGGVFDSFLNSDWFQGFSLRVAQYLPIESADLSNFFQELAGSIGGKLTEWLGGILTHLPGAFLSLAIVMVSLYFFLVDGPKVVLYFKRNSFFPPHQTDRLILNVGVMCRSVILAAVVSGVIQSLLEGTACILLGVPNFLLIGLLVFLGSFLPVVGSAPITLGVALITFLGGQKIPGMILLITAILIFGLDTLIRPLFLKGSSNLHPFLGFVAALGGLQTLGFLGIFFGPILATLFVTTLELLSEVRNHSS